MMAFPTPPPPPMQQQPIIHTTPYESIPNAADTYRKMTDMNENLHSQAETAQAKRDFSPKMLLQTPLGMAVIVFFAVAIILWIFNPPFTQKSKENEMDDEKQDPVKVLVLSGILGGLTFMIPTIHRKFQEAQLK